MSMDIKINEALNSYDFGGNVTECFPYGEGHINNTYCVCVKNPDAKKRKYILQRINSSVFKDPVKLMENMYNVTNYLRDEIIKNGGEYLRETLNIIKTKDNSFYYIDSDKEVWRAVYFIEDTICLQSVEKPEHFYESAKSFGKFMKQLSKFPAEKLHETIAKFHDTPNRLNNLKNAIKADKLRRVCLVKDEINFTLSRENDCSYLMDRLLKNELPLRVTHNDTKLNNILFDKYTQKGICIIDLDTIMPGLCANDFGDSIRFGASTASEDEPDLSKVHFNLELFEIYTKGYLEVTASILTEAELESLVWGSKLMTLECGMRFLTDYLEGDTYFQISRENHNLDRARTQLKLVYEMEQNFNKMFEIVRKHYKNR
jgi:thiamine kinase-like enzyme